MEITVNGKKHIVDDARENDELLEFLREDLDLTGTKNGCHVGICGACVVLVDGKPMRACCRKLKQVAGKEILTIEGLHGKDGGLHPLQQSFLDKGAVQCGFCIPGMIMTSHALLLQNHHPTRDEIRKAIANNICRCTGYVQIVDAVEATGQSGAYDKD
ncbi:MAG: (2Fe-2S)-binding protein [Proteobacteria bacterium]|nr:(2Fe-2S)-binding protein [Pseudomonadota bacterium]